MAAIPAEHPGGWTELLDYLRDFQILVPPSTGNATLDRVTIQSAMNRASPGDTVGLFPGETYIVDQAGTMATPSHGGTPYPYCLVIPTGITLDTNGSTIRLAPGALASMFRASNNVGSNGNIGIIGYGTLDGNNNALTTSTGYLVWFDQVSGIDLDIKVNNTVLGSINLEGCSNVRAPRIVIDTVAGLGLGVGQLPQPVTDSWFGYVEVRNVTQWPGQPVNFPGNPVVGVCIRTHFDTLIIKNSEAGIKVDQGSRDWTFGIVKGEVCGTTTNSGLKFQGTGGDWPLRCHAEHVHMTNCAGQGLYMDASVDCSVNNYIGENNATLGTTPDVWIGGTRDLVNSIRVTGSSSSGITLRNTAVDYRLGEVIVRNPLLAANGVTDSGGIGQIDRLLAIDDQGVPKMDRGYRSNSANSVCRIGYAEIRGATSNPIQRTVGDKVSVETFRTNQTVELDSVIVNTDVAYTVTPGASAERQIHTGTLTANRTITLANPAGALFGWPNKRRFKFTRTGAGAFNLDIGGLKNLATNQWCEVEADNTATGWKLVAFGSL